MEIAVIVRKILKRFRQSARWVERKATSAAARLSGTWNVVRSWLQHALEAAVTENGYVYLGKIIFNGAALTVAWLTAESLIDAANSSEQSNIRKEASELSSELYSEEPGKRQFALRGYESFIERYSENDLALDQARQALISYFDRWRNGRLKASESEKGKEVNAAIALVGALGRSGWYDSATISEFSDDFRWVEAGRPLGWKGSDDPRSIFLAANFGGMVFDRSMLKCLDFGPAIFERTTLSGVDMSGSSFEGVNAINANILTAKFRNSNFSKAEFSLSSISLTDFSSVKEQTCEQSSNRGISSDLNRARFQDASLTNVAFRETRLEAVDFSDALLTNIDFAKADGAYAIFRGATLQSVEFPVSSFRSADFSNAFLSDVIFDGSDLSGADFRNAKIVDALTFQSLTKAKDLKRANFSGTLLPAGSDICTLLGLGAVMVTDVDRWKLAGRPLNALAFASRSDQITLRLCEDRKP